MRLVDLTGRRFGSLLVIERAGSQWPVTWLCRCDCGIEKVMFGNNLKRGAAKTCGCKVDRMKLGRRTPLYVVWSGMIQRCTNPKAHKYGSYGGKGIGCEPWLTFDPFRDWAMANGYQPGLHLDRRDNDKGYSPDNCQWLTPEAHREKHYG